MSTASVNPTRLDILRTIYGDKFDGYLGLWSAKTKQTLFHSSSQLAQYSETAETLSEREDVYLCMSSQEKDVGPQKRGQIDTVAMVFACAADIDVGGEKDSGKNYPPDRETVLSILEKFEHPHTYLQNSGRGLHVIWILEKPMHCHNRAERRRAQSQSKAFQKMLLAHFASHGFDIDSVGDIMRLIRVQYTLNHNTSPPAPVTPLFFDPTIKLPNSLLENLAANVSNHNKGNREQGEADHFRIKMECGWYNHHTDEGSNASSEPEWYAALGITARCEDGHIHAHNYSARHPDYDESETDKKFDRALNEAGPRTCSAIEQDLDGASFCSECPNRNMVSSPIQLGDGYDPGNVGPVPIGYLPDGSFVFRDQVRDIILTRSSAQLLNYQSLLGLAPSTFWKIQFPKEGEFNTSAAGESLIKACNQAGPFNPRGIRGIGLWRDGDIIVENLGEPIPEAAKHMYLCFVALPLPNETLGDLDVDRIHDLLGEFPWRHPQDAIFLLGWLMIAPMCGALDWRVHMFLFGPANSGKTTLHKFGSQLLAPMAINADGASSAAGIRQNLGPDARPVLMDEFETDQDHKRLQAITKLARSASSADSRVLMGTPEGKAIEFAIKATFLFSAINVGGRSQADDSRIINVELTAHDSDKDTGRKIAETVAAFEDMGPTWCRFVADNALKVLETLNTLKIEMPPMDSRHALNMATLLAGAYVALNEAVPTPEQAKDWVELHLQSIDRHAQAHERDDAMECWEYLIAHPVRGNEQDFPLGHWIAVAIDELQKGDERKNSISEAQKILTMHNMRIMLGGDEQGLMIANGAPPIDAVFRDTKWGKGAWKRALGQIPGVFSPKNPVRIPSMSTKPRCTGIPFELIPDRIDNFSEKRKY